MEVPPDSRDLLLLLSQIDERRSAYQQGADLVREHTGVHTNTTNGVLTVLFVDPLPPPGIVVGAVHGRRTLGRPP